MKNIKIIVIFNVLLLCLGTNASAQGILGKLAKTGVGALKGTVKSTANLMVGSPEEIAASKRKDDPKAGNRNPEENKRTEPELGMCKPFL